MQNRRWRSVWFSGLVIIGLWIIALTGYTIAKNRQVTVERVRAYVESVNLAALSGSERAAAIKRLEEMLNALSPEERQKARLERLGIGWLKLMTDAEKTQFIEATM